MEILIITIVLPYPVDSGGTSGLFLMADYMRKSHRITFMCPRGTIENENQLRKLWPDVTFIFFDPDKETELTRSKKAIKMVKNVINPQKLSREQEFRKSMLLDRTNLVDYYYNNLIEVVKDTTSKKIFDLIQVEFIEIAPIIDFFPKGIPTTFVHHEIRYRIMKLEAETQKTKKIGDDWVIGNTKLLEIGLLNKFDKVFCVTQNDVDYLTSDGVLPGKAVASPSPVKFLYDEKEEIFEFQNRLVYLGPEFHFPNLDAIDWFLENCWTEIIQANPSLRFDIVGKWTPKTVKYLSEKYKNVFFHGFVPDLKELMSGAILIVPLRIGSGMRMKILEGVKWNIPIISTTIGSEGLPMQHGENCYIANNKEEFIKSVNALVLDSDLQNRFVKKSKNILQKGYSIEECGNLRQGYYEQLFLKNN